jgi:hypothetical protein
MSVRDFTLDFAVYDRNDINTKSFEDIEQSDAAYDYSRMINDILTAHTHTFSQDSSFRRLLVNTRDLMITFLIITKDIFVLCLKITVYRNGLKVVY